MGVIPEDAAGPVVSEGALRLGCFLFLLAAMALWQWQLPRRILQSGQHQRRAVNLCLALVDVAVVRVLFPAGAVYAAVWSQSRGWGLLAYVNPPVSVEAILGFLILDLSIYGQHVAFHAIPVLWRVHRVHHTDLDLDVTSGLRFHPVEIVLSMVLKVVVVVVFGVSPWAVVVFEIVLNGTALFNHANAFIPERIERVVRWLVVTPDMHRIHHSVDIVESNRNFGFNLPWWDRIFGTYCAAPAAGQVGMSLGLEPWTATPLNWWRCMALPFVRSGRGDSEPD